MKERKQRKKEEGRKEGREEQREGKGKRERERKPERKQEREKARKEARKRKNHPKLRGAWLLVCISYPLWTEPWSHCGTYRVAHRPGPKLASASCWLCDTK